MAERLLARIADRQVQPHRGDDEDEPVAEEVDAVVLQQWRDEKEHGSEQQADAERQSLHTFRSTFLPSSPCGLKKMTAMKMTSATASLYAAEM